MGIFRTTKLNQFVTSNNTKDPAMWWAESLMSYGWLDTSFKIKAAESAIKEDGRWQSGSMGLYPLLPRQNLFASLTHTPQTSAPIQTNPQFSLPVSSTLHTTPCKLAVSYSGAAQKSSWTPLPLTLFTQYSMHVTC